MLKFQLVLFSALILVVSADVVPSDDIDVAFRIRQTTQPIIGSEFFSAVASAAGLPDSSIYITVSQASVDLGDRQKWQTESEKDDNEPKETVIPDDNDRWIVSATLRGNNGANTAEPALTASAAASGIAKSLESTTSSLRKTHHVDAYQLSASVIGLSCSQIICQSDELCYNGECQFGTGQTGLTHDEAAGIAVGCIAFVLIGAVVFCAMKAPSEDERRKRHQQAINSEASGRDLEKGISVDNQQLQAPLVAKKSSRKEKKVAVEEEDGSSSSYFSDESSGSSYESSSSESSSSS